MDRCSTAATGTSVGVPVHGAGTPIRGIAPRWPGRRRRAAASSLPRGMFSLRMDATGRRQVLIMDVAGGGRAGVGAPLVLASLSSGDIECSPGSAVALLSAAVGAVLAAPWWRADGAEVAACVVDVAGGLASGRRAPALARRGRPAGAERRPRRPARGCGTADRRASAALRRWCTSPTRGRPEPAVPAARAWLPSISAAPSTPAGGAVTSPTPPWCGTRRSAAAPTPRPRRGHP